MASSPNMPNRLPSLGADASDPYLEAAKKAREGSTPEQPACEAADETDRASTDGQPKGPDAFVEALRHLGEAREYAEYLAAAEIDKFKLKLRKIAVLAAAGVVAGILGLSILISAAAILLQGIAQMIGEALGGRFWAGALITGGGILVVTALAAWLGLRFWQAAAFKSLKSRYEYRKRKQRAQFGHSVDPLDDLSQ
jgi:hypothetical protein